MNSKDNLERYLERFTFDSCEVREDGDYIKVYNFVDAEANVLALYMDAYGNIWSTKNTHLNRGIFTVLAVCKFKDEILYQGPAL